MDTASVILGLGFLVFAFLAYYLSRSPKKNAVVRSQSGEGNDNDENTAQRRPRGPAEPVGDERIAGARRVVRQRNRPTRPRAADVFDQSGSEEDEEDDLPDVGVLGQNIGAKKRKKLELKAEKRAQRQAELTEREEKKERDARLEEERKKEKALEQLTEDQRLEEERKEREEQERIEHEAYLKLKESFQVVDEGVDAQTESETQNLLQQFLDHIKSSKVVLLEDLAAHFKLRTQECIDRVQKLQADGELTGVIDDRGKFIYISLEELQAVAKFVKQRGRVSIADLAESSNKLIQLQTEKVKV